MIEYKSTDWINFIFRFHKSDTIRQLFPVIIILALYTAGVAYLELDYFKLSDKSYLKNVNLMHSILSFVISMLLVFRTNTAYDRWWEGRKLWGSLVNNSRNLAIKLAAFLNSDDLENRTHFKKLIAAYPHALRNHLSHESTRIELFDDDALNKKIELHKHVPNQIALMIVKRINKLYLDKKITNEQFIILNDEMQTFTDVCGACERIKNTPIPFSYSAFLKKFIFIFVVTLPFGFAFSLGYLVVPVVCFVFYVLASLELIAEEIEDPFGNDANDLPTKKIASNIHKHIYEIL